PPQLCHIVVRHVHTLGALDERSHLPTRPMRQASLGRRTGPSRRQNPSTNRSRHLLPARPARSVKQTGDPVSLVPVQPQIHRRSRHTRQRGNLFLPPPLSPPHHDSRPRRHGCRRVRAVRQRSQLFPVIRFQLHTIIKHEIRNNVKLIESRDTRPWSSICIVVQTHQQKVDDFGRQNDLVQRSLLKIG